MVKRTKDAGVKIGVKLPKEYVDKIDEFVKEGKFLSMADFVRECVRLNFEKVKNFRGKI